MEAERDVLAAAAGVTPERCRAAKAQLFEAAKLCAPTEALPGYSVEFPFGHKGAGAMPFAKLWCLEGCSAPQVGMVRRHHAVGTLSHCDCVVLLSTEPLVAGERKQLTLTDTHNFPAHHDILAGSCSVRPGCSSSMDASGFLCVVVTRERKVSGAAGHGQGRAAGARPGAGQDRSGARA